MRFLVVGSGPVGLIFCAKLSQGGHESVLIERNHLDKTCSRASTLQPASLELLSEFNLYPEILRQGRLINELRSWDIIREFTKTVSYDCLSSCTDYPYRFHLDQSYLRRGLIEYLRKSKRCYLLDQACATSVLFDRCNQGVSVAVSFNGLRGDTQVLHGDYLIVCDGARSHFRSQLAVDFEGYDLPSPVVRLSIHSIPDTLERCLSGVTYAHSCARSVSCLSMSEGWRFVLRPRLSELSAAVLDSMWARQCLADLFDDFVEPEWWMQAPAIFDYYWVSQRSAQTRMVKRSFLLGDAAHVTNTRGGLNLNFGLLEAYSLASLFVSGAGLDEFERWNMRWLRLTREVLMARTAQWLSTGYPLQQFYLSDEFSILMRSSLLDISVF